MRRKLPPLGLVGALLSPVSAAAQVARLAAASAPGPIAVVAPPTSAPSLLGAAPLAAAATLGAATASLAAPTAAAAPAAAVFAAQPALDALAAGAPALVSPSRPAGVKAEAGRFFDLSAARPAAGADEVLAPSPSRAAAPPLSPAPPARPAARRLAPQAVERLKTLAGRALALPAHVWPFAALARLVAHGEPLVGLTPAGAARAAERFEPGGGLVIGRLAWELRDAWSVRGAERSYLRLIARLREAKARRPGLDAAVSVDAESLGLHLRGVAADERERLAGDAVLRVARAAADAGLPLEIDMGTSDAMPAIVRIAERVVREERAPVRLALAARYGSSLAALSGWAVLAEETGLRLGVRLVKGSFIEAGRFDAINRRRALLDRYKTLITSALRYGTLDVAVASHNAEIWEYARGESRRLGADFSMHVIRGVNRPLQAEMRAAGKIGRQYVSYGLDAPIMGLTELYTNWRQRRLLSESADDPID